MNHTDQKRRQPISTFIVFITISPVTKLLYTPKEQSKYITAKAINSTLNTPPIMPLPLITTHAPHIHMQYLFQNRPLILTTLPIAQRGTSVQSACTLEKNICANNAIQYESMTAQAIAPMQQPQINGNSHLLSICPISTPASSKFKAPP